MTREEHPLGTVVTFSHRDKPVRFLVTNKDDIIQKRHYGGVFYEVEELDLIATAFNPGGVFLDVGTNVGNHAIYAVQHLGASRVICVEPNPDAIAILRANIMLNQLAKSVDTGLVGV